MREIEAGLLNEDFIDFLKSLKENQVESLLVGGYAVVLHGYHRTTGDIDIWIKPTSENYGRLRKALAEFGLPLDAITRDNFLSSDQVDGLAYGDSDSGAINRLLNSLPMEASRKDRGRRPHGRR